MDMETPYFSTQFRGYDKHQVDRAIERVRSAIDIGRPPHPDSLLSLEFQMTFRGYNTKEVDQYFDDIADSVGGG
ncbi:DivIVA domain-containing protein [Haloglycomyces albus]|uniref:DivIVA domain-containing protein n=1 Tax=Haloglycomyces albus TaxID=526067 RepID=UPI00046D2769|nr:DivIVA domain-containing protein [Haloglycomyces albus]